MITPLAALLLVLQSPEIPQSFAPEQCIEAPDGQFISRIIVNLDGAQEIPGTRSVAKGIGELILNQKTGELSGEITYKNLSGLATMAHIHHGKQGTNGPVVVGLVDREMTEHSGRFAIPTKTILNSEQMGWLRTGELYFNIHSVLYKTGEIRGQILGKICLKSEVEASDQL